MILVRGILNGSCMGFGSYDESEQESQDFDTDIDENNVGANGSEHDGEIEYEIGASNNELLDRLEEIKDE